MGPRDSAPSANNVVSDSKQHGNPKFGEWCHRVGIEIGRNKLKEWFQQGRHELKWEKARSKVWQQKHAFTGNQHNKCERSSYYRFPGRMPRGLMSFMLVIVS